MSLRRISIFAATLMTIAVSAWHGVVAAVERAFHVVVETIAGDSRPLLAGNGGFTGLLVRDPDYDAPPQHFIRHEAGTAQRGAHRGI